ncbi:MAG TPA: hypothetical protein VHQ47_11820 [Phycisphaerae bacterium]|nr:hypothetical protein [Phycisphaerae bacterium]
MHDHVVYAYSVDCEERRVVVHTVYRGGPSAKFTDVIFGDVVAHYFEHVLPENILFDVAEADVAAVVREHGSLLADSWRYRWPAVEYRGDLDVLIEKLKAAGVRAYVIESSYGLSGWVLAGSCKRVARGEAARVM